MLKNPHYTHQLRYAPHAYVRLNPKALTGTLHSPATKSTSLHAPPALSAPGHGTAKPNRTNPSPQIVSP